MIRMLRRFWHAESGMAMVEFGLLLPMMMTMFYGCIEVTRYILIVQKTEKLAHTIADVTAQSKTVTIASENQLFEATEDIMDPFGTGANSRILVSSLYRAAGSPNALINWRLAGGGTMTVTSALGNVGAVPTMPGGFTFNERENVIAAEVYYRFTPLISNRFFGTTTIYRSAFYKPRLGQLTTTPT